MSDDRDPIYLGNIWGKTWTKWGLIFLIAFAILTALRYFYLVQNDQWDPSKFDEIEVTK